MPQKAQVPVKGICEWCLYQPCLRELAQEASKLNPKAAETENEEIAARLRSPVFVRIENPKTPGSPETSVSAIAPLDIFHAKVESEGFMPGDSISFTLFLKPAGKGVDEGVKITTEAQSGVYRRVTVVLFDPATGKLELHTLQKGEDGKAGALLHQESLTPTGTEFEHVLTVRQAWFAKAKRCWAIRQATVKNFRLCLLLSMR